MPLVVRNAGQNVARGASVIFDRDYAFSSTGSFSNCFYRSGQATACTFDQALTAGTTYRGVMPYELRPGTYAPSRSVNQLEWLTAGEFEDRQAELVKEGLEGFGTAGTGGVLKLAAQSSAKARQGDVNPDNNWTNVEVEATGKNGTDLVAIDDGRGR